MGGYWQHVKGFSIEQADADDISAIAALFTQAFLSSVLHHCGRLPKPQAMEDVFSLVQAAEPAAAFIVRDEAGQVKGYCFAPARLYDLWWRAVWGGHLWKWLLRWLTGAYGFGLYPIKVIVYNKLAFIGSSISVARPAGGRILSIAVAAGSRGRGLGKILLAAALAYLERQNVSAVRLEVRPDNPAALRLYERAGFTICGNSWDSQGQWLIMRKEMGSS